jgi:hypothetical protein
MKESLFFLIAAVRRFTPHAAPALRAAGAVAPVLVGAVCVGPPNRPDRGGAARTEGPSWRDPKTKTLAPVWHTPSHERVTPDRPARRALWPGAA